MEKLKSLLEKLRNQSWWHKPRFWFTDWRKPHFWFYVLITVLVILLLIHLVSLFFARHHVTPPTTVVLAKARSADVPVYLSALGSVIPTYSVTVRTQINGTMLRVLFVEGQMVKAGQLLAEIDPRPYQAQLMEYEGQLIRDQALLDNALIDLKRYQVLWKQDSISQQQLATQSALVRQYEGTVQVDKGLIAATKVNLYYCEITSPMDGRIGLRLVDPGNFVQTSDQNGIAVINTLNPITVIFTLAEDNIQEILHKIYAGQPFQVEAFDRQQNNLLAVGSLLTIDNQIDPSTGTVKLRAQFANNENKLFPSQFVNVRLLAKTLQNATLIPTAGIQFSTQGPFVYVVDNNQIASIKRIKTGITYGNDTVIDAGLTSGELVVVEGADRLIEGAKVNVARIDQPGLLKMSFLKRLDGVFYRYNSWRFLA